MKLNDLDKIIKKSLDGLDIPSPSVEQKQKILETILVQEPLHPGKNVYSHFSTFIFEYPWRFAFGTSIIQALSFTLLFGSRYTNILIETFVRR